MYEDEQTRYDDYVENGGGMTLEEWQESNFDRAMEWRDVGNSDTQDSRNKMLRELK